MINEFYLQFKYSEAVTTQSLMELQKRIKKLLRESDDNSKLQLTTLHITYERFHYFKQTWLQNRIFSVSFYFNKKSQRLLPQLLDSKPWKFNTGYV